MELPLEMDRRNTNLATLALPTYQVPGDGVENRMSK